MRISEIITPKIFSVGPQTSIAEGGRLMGEMDVGVLPVIDQGRLVGIVTDRDIAVRGTGRGVGPEAPVSEVMSGDVTTCRDDEEVDEVLERMADMQVRRMPVCAADGRIIGMFSLGDAARDGEEENEVAQALRGICRPGRQHSQAFVAA
jgi:CBS domain-containing protein